MLPRLSVLGLLPVLLLSAAALACDAPARDEAALYAAARDVFVARVLSTQLRRLTPRQCEVNAMQAEHCAYVLGRFETVEVFKGAPPRRGEVRDLVATPGNCSLGLMAGQYYVFYTDTEQRWVPRQRGSFVLGPYLDDAARARLAAIGETRATAAER